jgi:hypothetical protein
VRHELDVLPGVGDDEPSDPVEAHVLPIEAEVVTVEGLRTFNVGHREVDCYSYSVHVFLQPSGEPFNRAA